MDIEARLSLRSFVKPDLTPLLKAILGALFIHVLFWVNWSSEKNSTVAEIPEWVNIKLIAGFEPTDEKIEKTEVKQLKPKTTYKKEKRIEKNRTTQEIKEKNISSSSATTFVAADSRPYLLENPKPVYPAAARRRGMQGVVLLGVAVSKEGYVDKIDILQTSGFKVLDRSAVKSVKSWRFIPARMGEKNISSQMEIPIRFILKT